MTDRPIIFSGPMVRAILAEIERPGTGKTQTRRLLATTNKNAEDRRGPWEASTVGGPGVFGPKGDPFPKTACLWHPKAGTVIVPKHTIGDRLWVRESCKFDWSDQDWRYSADGMSVCTERHYAIERPRIDRWPTGSMPSIYMPRVVSRLTLTVTDVRVERLQAISEADAKAEGIAHAVPPFGDWSLISPIAGIAWTPADNPPPQIRFAYLWNSINGKRPGAAWADNPWIVAVTFTAERRNIDSPQWHGVAA